MHNVFTILLCTQYKYILFDKGSSLGIKTPAKISSSLKYDEMHGHLKFKDAEGELINNHEE